MVEKERKALNFMNPKNKISKRHILLLFPCIHMKCTNLIIVRSKSDETINIFGCVGYGQLNFYKFIMKTKTQKQQLPRVFAPFSKMSRSSCNQYYLNIDGEYFRFVDVPGDGNRFYHCILKDRDISSRFHNVEPVRRYLRAMVPLRYKKDEALQIVPVSAGNIINCCARVLNLVVNGLQLLIY